MPVKEFLKSVNMRWSFEVTKLGGTRHSLLTYRLPVHRAANAVQAS